MTDRLLTADEAAELLGVQVSWLRQQTRAGNVPHVRLGRYVRYDRDDLAAWVESLKHGGGPAWRKYRAGEIAGARGE